MPVLQRLAAAIDDLIFSYYSECLHNPDDWFEDAPLYMRPWQPGEQYCGAAYVPIHRFSPFPVRYEFVPWRFYIGDDGSSKDVPLELPEDVDVIADAA